MNENRKKLILALQIVSGSITVSNLNQNELDILGHSGWYRPNNEELKYKAITTIADIVTPYVFDEED